MGTGTEGNQAFFVLLTL